MFFVINWLQFNFQKYFYCMRRKKNDVSRLPSENYVFINRSYVQFLSPVCATSILLNILLIICFWLLLVAVVIMYCMS